MCFQYQPLTRNFVKSVLDLGLLKGWMWCIDNLKTKTEQLHAESSHTFIIFNIQGIWNADDTADMFSSVQFIFATFVNILN